MKNKLNILKYGLTVIVSVLIVGTVVWANNTYNIENATIENTTIVEAPEQEERQYGAFPGPDVYEQMRFHEGFIERTGIDIAYNQSATSSAIGTERATSTPHWCYTGTKDIEVRNWFWERSTANGLWPSNISIGTTTCNGTIVNNRCGGTSSLTNTTTATIVAKSHLGSAVTGIFDLQGYADLRYTNLYNLGTASSTRATSTLGTSFASRANQFHSTTSPFTMSPGVCITFHDDNEGATSSASWTSAGGFTTPVGRLHADLFYK